MGIHGSLLVSLKQSEVTRGTSENLQMRFASAFDGAEKLCGLSPYLHAIMAENARIDAEATEKGQLPELCKCVQAARVIGAGTVRNLRKPGFSNAPRRLRQAAAGPVALPALPHEPSRARGFE